MCKIIEVCRMAQNFKDVDFSNFVEVFNLTQLFMVIFPIFQIPLRVVEMID